MEESCLSNRSTSFLDFLLSGLTDFAAFHGEFGRDVAIAEHLDGDVGSLHQAGSLEGLHVDGGTIFEAGFEVGDIDNSNFVLETGVIETTLGKTAMQRHLTTFKAGTNATAGAGLLPLVAATTGLAKAGAFTATETLNTMLSTAVWFESMKIHDRVFSLKFSV